MSLLDGTAMQFVPLDGTKFAIKTTFDMQPNIDSATALRNAGKTGTKDAWHVARIDKRMMDKIIKDAGLKWDDVEACRDLIDRMLKDGTLAKLRVHEGSY